MKCLECNADFSTTKILTNHLKRAHKISGESYTAKHFHGGKVPTCKICGSLARYVDLSFEECCIATESNLAQTHGKGHTEETLEHLRRAALLKKQ